MTDSFWRGRSVFVSGHTGFKGSWLSLWLQYLGAQVHGLSLAPPSEPSLFVEASVGAGMASSVIADVANLDAVRTAVAAARPEVVFHLAAQSLVRASYAEPPLTYLTNVVGTANILEAVRLCPGVRSVISVTTDKCYANREWLWSYREDDPLGGDDPYSASKACAEIVTASFRRSFLAAAGVATASARAGNVIGGGDWAVDRLLPDVFRAVDADRPLGIRYPDSTRPWQHVLEPLAGYLQLAEALFDNGEAYAEAWNFGPTDRDARPVRWLLEQLSSRLPGLRWEHVGGSRLHEAGVLKLDSSKARARLGWRPVWSLETALEQTVSWHLAWRSRQHAKALCLEQIARYDADRSALHE